MSLPVAIYSLRVPPGGQVFPAVPLGLGASFRVTMAAIDPTETPVREDVDDASEPFAVLKMSRITGGLDDEDEDSEDDDLYSDEDSEDDDDLNGGPSDLKAAKSLKKKALLEALAADDEDEDMEDDSENSGDDTGDEAEAQEVLAKLQKALKEDKGKGKAAADDDDDEEDEDEDSDDDSEALEVTESVVCTLNRNNFPQQVLDFTVGARDQVFFKVLGNFTVYLTGNYLMPPDDDDHDHDLEPDSDEELDELDGLDDLVGDSDSEIDELDDLDDPRIAEIEDDEDSLDMKKLIKQAGELKKGKNKRPAEDSDDDEPALDDMISKSLKQEEGKKATAPAAAAEATTNGETKKLSKSEKKRLKKLKNNEGAAADAPAPAAAAPETNGTKDKKVQFAKELEQGPTPSPSTTTKPNAATPAASTSAPSVRTVQGISIDDRKVGNGPAAKKGSTLSMRYIGKLDSGKVFDSNKSGKPFSFKLGKGEVIKGWDIGLEGLQNGGERRIKIPANLAYGKKGAPPDIPPNSALTFDVKCVGVK